MDNTELANLETDLRFPSGPWTGYFLQKVIPGRHLMGLRITFRQGMIRGEGRDWVGTFVLSGHYDLADGKCRWTKRYLGKHDVDYQGFNEGKGIWGTWQITSIADPDIGRGGFHIWPEGMPDPTLPAMNAEAELPAPLSRGSAPMRANGSPGGVRADWIINRRPRPFPLNFTPPRELSQIYAQQFTRLRVDWAARSLLLLLIFFIFIIFIFLLLFRRRKSKRKIND